MKRLIKLFLLLCFFQSGYAQTNLFVSPNGDDSNDGSITAPLASIQTALDRIEPGATIYLREGTYFPTTRLCPPRKATTKDSYITLSRYNDEHVVIDGSKMNPTSTNDFKHSRCMYLNYWANYWHIYGIDFCNALDNGMKIEGSYNIIENCKFYGNNDTGLQIGMYKDWSIEENNGYVDDNGNKVSGQPEYNPNYQFCRGNTIINCDAYENYDALQYGGTADDGGDADGFACKLFPGPGTEFVGCRAWYNSDDNWDLYMTYHPVVIENCWAWKAGHDKNGSKTPGNGNGFKLGGGGSAGGAAFSQSTGSHVVYNCVSFNNLVKGFDQNNAYEGMYIINNTAWGNDYNYRFPTIVEYGSMYLRNNIGFNAVTANHEFLSANKDGAKVPDTEYNSWITFDGCDAYKDGNKVNGTKVYAQDHSTEFVDLTEASAKAARQADGSLPDNQFAHLKEGSIFVDAGTNITNFSPARMITESENAGLEMATPSDITIPYAGVCADMGAFELGAAKISALTHTTGDLNQTVYRGSAISPVTCVWKGEITDVKISGLLEGLTAERLNSQITIKGSLNNDAIVTITGVNEDGNAVEGVDIVTLNLKVSDVMPGSLTCTTDNKSQTVFLNSNINPIVFERGGGATSFAIENLPNGLTSFEDGNKLTISGAPTESGSYTVTAKGGMTEVVLGGTISVELPHHTLGAATGSDWYQFQTALEELPSDLNGHVKLNFDDADSYGQVYSTTGSTGSTSWNATYKDSGYSPVLSSQGACNIGSGSAIEWNLPSCRNLKINLYSTGKRNLIIKYLRHGKDTDWVVKNLSEISKGTYPEFDILAYAGIESYEDSIDVIFECASKSSKMLGIRVYDMLVDVYGEVSTTGINGIVDNGGEMTIHQTNNGLVLVGDGSVSKITLYNISGATVAESLYTRTLYTGSLNKGVYVVRATLNDGKTMTKKIQIR